MKRLQMTEGVTYLTALLFAVPVVTVIAHLFLPSGGTWQHLADTVLPSYIGNSLVLLLTVGIGTAVIGAGTAWLVVMCRFPGRGLFEWALILPLAVPTYVIAYAYTDLLQFSGPVQSWIRDAMDWGPLDFRLWNIRSLGGAAFVFSVVLYPYVYLIARAAFLQQSQCVLEAARTLGCTPWSAFRRVAMPLARPAIVAGMALALMETLADYGAVSYFGVPTFTTGIYRAWFSLGDKVAAAQLATMLLMFVILLLSFEAWSRRRQRFHHTTGRFNRLSTFELKGGKASAAIAACALPIILGFAIPALVLASMLADASNGADGGQFTARYFSLIGNTLTLGVITATLAVLLALIVAYALRRGESRAIGVAGRLAGLGYAIPGSIIAVGVLIPFAALDNFVDGWSRDTLGISTGLLLTGSIAALVFAYLVRFLSVSLQAVRSGLGKITGSMDDAAATLGLGQGATIRRVHVPLLRGSLLTALLLVLVDVMKELPATLIMRPFNFDTLAVQAHNLAADERLAEAALPALSIVLIGLVPVILLSRLVAASRPGESDETQDTEGLERAVIA